MKESWAYLLGKAERQLFSDVAEFEREMDRIDRTTYWDKDKPRLESLAKFREAIWRYQGTLHELNERFSEEAA